MRASVAALGLVFAVPAQAQQDEELCAAWANSPAALAEIEGRIRRDYAYTDRVEDIDALFAAFRVSAAQATSLAELGSVTEALGYAFRDGHFHIRPSVGPERAWIPSSSDFWIERKEGRWIVSDVKQLSEARARGIRPGWEVLSMDGAPIEDLARAALKPVAPQPSDEQIEYGVNVVLTGRLNQARQFVFTDGTQQRQIELPPAQQSFGDRPSGTMQVIDHEGITRIRFNNSLGNNALIAEFDALMKQQADARAIILDFRDTPGGGNTTVARTIMGHFISESSPYQAHRIISEEMQFGVRRQHMEYVFPRGTTFEKPVVVLAGRWTGSVGEALAMAFDTAIGAHTIGTPLADLLGTLNRSRVDNNCMSLDFAWDKLFSVEGTPREDWVPAEQMASGDTGRDGGDPALAQALDYLAGRLK